MNVFLYVDPFWVKGTLAKMLTNVTYDSLITLVARDMPIVGSHVGSHVSGNVCVRERFVHSWAAKPSAELIFCILELPCE